MDGPRGSGRADPITIGLFLVRAVVLIVAVHAAATGPIHDDLERFRQIFLQPGIPYRDFPVEYAPIEVVLIRVFGSGSGAALGGRVAVIAALADVGTWAALRWGWDRATALRYLWLGAPMLVFLYTRLDLVPVALAAWGAALAIRGRARTGGLSLAASALTKLWTVVVFPALAIERRSRALAWATIATMVGVVAWLAVGGPSGVAQVVTFRRATGWGVESVPGSIVWVLTGGPVRLEAGAPRVGTVPTGSSVVLGIALAAALTAIWLVAFRRRASGFGAASLAAVAALLVFAPLLSLQYVAWLLPWAALAATEDRRLYRLAVVASILTAILFIVYAPDRIVASQVFLAARNLTLVAIPVLWLAPSSRSTHAGAGPVT